MSWKHHVLSALPLALLLAQPVHAQGNAMTRLDIEVLCQAMPYRCPQGAAAATAAHFQETPPPIVAPLPSTTPAHKQARKPERREAPASAKPSVVPTVQAPTPPPASVPASSPPLTPAAALVMEECAKAVLAGARFVTMQHIADIDTCAALARSVLRSR